MLSNDPRFQRCLSCRVALSPFAKLSLPLLPLFDRIQVEPYPRAIGHFIRVETRRDSNFFGRWRDNKERAERQRVRGGGKFAFLRDAPPSHSGVYNGGGAFHAACSCSRFVHRVSFVHPCNSCNDNLYEKCFPPFPRHRRCFPPLRARIVPHARNVGHLTIGQETWRVLPGWAKIPSMRLKAATKWGKEFPRK